MGFKGVFATVVLATALIVAALLVQSKRPAIEVTRPTADLVRANGKCAECHLHETSSVVHEYELSRHNTKGVNCLDCHRPMEGQEAFEHRGFTITRTMTAANCRQCHATEYDQYSRSRHGTPAWAAVSGPRDFTPEQIAFAEQYHPGTINRAANPVGAMEGRAAVTSGCNQCHDIGKPNADGTIGTCTECHSRHASSVALARTPETCGQCHMGPDHSQIEIYHESKHGVIYNAQKAQFHMDARPGALTAADMPSPTCATCHMSGLEGQQVTHDTTERLSYFLFAEVSDKRPHHAEGQAAMKQTCLKCHTTSRIDKFYREAKQVVGSTNELVKEANSIIKGLRDEGLLTPKPFDEPLEYVYFDLWHYFGRTAKHGAFMGGADFVQWHGFYELQNKLTEIRRQAEELRQAKAAHTATPPAPPDAPVAPAAEPAPAAAADPVVPAAEPARVDTE